MTFQASLFTGPALARRSDPETSQAAARSVEASGRADAQRAKCLQAVRDFPGRTAVELAAVTKSDRYMFSRRLPELAASGQIHKGPPRLCQVHNTAMLTWLP